jgi:hypothetical protein
MRADVRCPEEVAQSVLPAESRAIDFDILPFDHALYLSPRHLEPQKSCSVSIVEHNQHYFAPVDDCEESCLWGL